MGGAATIRQAYASPMLVTIGGVRQILVVTRRAHRWTVTRDRAICCGSTRGRRRTGINVAQPLLIGDDRIYLSVGLRHGRGRDSR